MLSNSHQYIEPANEAERIHLESLVRADFDKCHPNDNFEAMKRRATFTKEDKGLLRDWMALAASRARIEQQRTPFDIAAA